MRGDFEKPIQVSQFRVWNRRGFENRFNNGKIEFFNGDDLVAAVDIKIAGGSGGDRNRRLGEVWGTPGIELLNSQDRNFRPTDAGIGEDGSSMSRTGRMSSLGICNTIFETPTETTNTAELCGYR